MIFFLICWLAFITSTVSGLFGMAGGMILMGSLPFFFSPGESILLHGVIQGFANFHRFLGLRKSIPWDGVGIYVFGGLIAYVILRQIQFIPDRKLLYLFLSLCAFSATLNWFPVFMGFEKKLGAFLCGLLVNAIQMVCGVAGPVLDLFFRDRLMPKERVVATKSVTQAFSHSLKIALMGEILWQHNAQLTLGLTEIAIVLFCSGMGTTLGKRGLVQMSQNNFYLWTSRILVILGSLYLLKALSLFLA